MLKNLSSKKLNLLLFSKISHRFFFEWLYHSGKLVDKSMVKISKSKKLEDVSTGSSFDMFKFVEMGVFSNFILLSFRIKPRNEI